MARLVYLTRGHRHGRQPAYEAEVWFEEPTPAERERLVASHDLPPHEARASIDSLTAKYPAPPEPMEAA